MLTLQINREDGQMVMSMCWKEHTVMQEPIIGGYDPEGKAREDFHEKQVLSLETKGEKG